MKVVSWHQLESWTPAGELEIKLSKVPACKVSSFSCDNVHNTRYIHVYTNAPFLGQTLLDGFYQDVSIYKQNFEQKPSFNFDSMNMKDII